jgi:hypothetical protein
MSSMLLSRRGALLTLGAAALGPGCASTAASGPALYKQFRAVQVDVKPLAATGDTISAGVIAETAPAWVQHYFGPYIAPGDKSAPTLVIRYQMISFGMEGSAAGVFNNGAMDYIQAEGDVIGAGGRTLSTYPLTCSLFTVVDLNDPSGNYERRRITNLGQAVAQFMPGKIGL